MPNAVLINSIARTLGLHDFYQVGLWNYCEGYEGSGQGITGCSAAVLGYWFNPVEILLEELLAGATSMFLRFLLLLRVWGLERDELADVRDRGECSCPSGQRCIGTLSGSDGVALDVCFVSDVYYPDLPLHSGVACSVAAFQSR